ncbi:hypothetical protein HPB47_012708 [Ixodes persulcatus]|uniref:Uncharacterized protein n=1 Tax=Ixodes persulcatus TaxID=34615 RepID=A0AC60NST2_IXOPE|nr:hypothetical protein HPB47_012708 [Ixodes persulcatus]
MSTVACYIICDIVCSIACFSAVAFTSTGQVKTCATNITTSPEQAEKAAIARALIATPCPKVIVSDSKSSILNFAKAHAGLCGNELAHSTARGYTVRVGWTQLRDHGARSACYRLV